MNVLCDCVYNYQPVLLALIVKYILQVINNVDGLLKYLMEINFLLQVFKNKLM